MSVESPTITPSQAADAAAVTVVQQRMAEQRQALEDSLDIRDPGRPQAKPESPPVPESAKKLEAPNTLPGASANGGLTQDLLDRAADLGLSEDDARAIPAASLRRLVTRLERQQPGPEPQFVDPAFVDPALQPEVEQVELMELPDLDPNYFDEQLVQAWGSLKGHAKQQQEIIAQQQAMIEEMRQATLAQQQQAQAARNRQDLAALEKMIGDDKSMADVLGEGPAAELDSRRHLLARQEIAELMDDMHNRAVRSGRTPPPIDQLYRRAKAALYPEKIEEKAQAEVADRLRDAKGQFIAKPTATDRSSDLPPGPERATRALEKLMRYGRQG